MNCAKCGADLSPNMKFCTKCGQRVDVSPQTSQMPGKPAMPQAPRPMAPQTSQMPGKPAMPQAPRPMVPQAPQMPGKSAMPQAPRPKAPQAPRMPSDEDKGIMSRIGHGIAAAVTGGSFSQGYSRQREREHNLEDIIKTAPFRVQEAEKTLKELKKSYPQVITTSDELDIQDLSCKIKELVNQPITDWGN